MEPGPGAAVKQSEFLVLPLTVTLVISSLAALVGIDVQ